MRRVTFTPVEGIPASLSGSVRLIRQWRDG
jgi:hypothetical protein